jgi:hypothetical protein
MKTILTISAIILAASALNSSGVATIDMNNYGSSANPIYIYYTSLLPTKGSYVELLVHNGNSWTPVSRITDDRTSFPLTEPGYFDAGVCRVPSVPDYGTAEFKLMAWSGATEPQYATYNGEVTWSQSTGAWTSPTQQPFGPDLANPSITLIPEPTTLVLGLLGGAFVMLCRRKTVQ